MIYEDYYTMSEINSWTVETDIPWEELDPDKAQKQKGLLTQLRDACIIESYHPIGTGNLMKMLEDDIDATAILSIELFEGFRHFYVLKKYLEAVSFTKRLTDRELRQLRKRAIAKKKVHSVTDELFNFIFSEHFAAYFFLRIARKSKEPVLKTIATFIAKDEFRHAQAAFDIMRARIQRREVQVKTILEAAYNFRHYGHDIVDEVPVFERNDTAAINAFVKKIEILTGKRLIDYVKETKIE